MLLCTLKYPRQPDYFPALKRWTFLWLLKGFFVIGASLLYILMVLWLFAWSWRKVGFEFTSCQWRPPLRSVHCNWSKNYPAYGLVCVDLLKRSKTCTIPNFPFTKMYDYNFFVQQGAQAHCGYLCQRSYAWPDQSCDQVMCTCKSKAWWFNSVAVSFLVFLFKSCCFYFWQWNHVLHADALGVLVWLSVCLGVCASPRLC